MAAISLADLLDEHDSAQSYSIDLTRDLDASQVAWRPDENSSAIGWHLGHQAAVNHYMVRNLTAAEVSFDEAFDKVFDSATPERLRGDLPSIEDTIDYRRAIAASTRRVISRIDDGDVGAPEQLHRVAVRLMCGVIDHEYQHAKWIEEVRALFADAPPPAPGSRRLMNVDGYWMIDAT
ncbi:MAG: DinB family protein [Acidimicrobiales bacterium]